MATTTSPHVERVIYPERDGTPMGETDTHIRAIIDTISALSDFYRLDPNVLVGGNMMMYYVEGDPRQTVSPDSFVVFGVPKYSRRVYKVWEEGVPPTVVFEFTSRSTGREDIESKPALYASLGVQEYVLFDPLGELFKRHPLRGFRLVEGQYEPLVMDAQGRLRSEALGLLLQQEGTRLRFIDMRTGAMLPWADEANERARVESERARVEAAGRQEAEARARAEAEARARAEAQIAHLQAELARLRGDSSS